MLRDSISGGCLALYIYTLHRCVPYGEVCTALLFQLLLLGLFHSLCNVTQATVGLTDLTPC